MSLAIKRALTAIWLGAIVCCLGCSQPQRPTGIGPAALWVESAKTGYWKVCSATERAGVHCTIWNKGGTVLMDEDFLPLDGGRAPISDDLAISDGACIGPYEVCLKNGRILVPESMFERMKAVIQGPKN